MDQKATRKDQITLRLREAACSGCGIYVDAADVEMLINLITVAGITRWIRDRMHAKLDSTRSRA